jgi:hypothetical protein
VASVLPRHRRDADTGADQWATVRVFETGGAEGGCVPYHRVRRRGREEQRC